MYKLVLLAKRRYHEAMHRSIGQRMQHRSADFLR